jgi:hypothetical protein
MKTTTLGTLLTLALAAAGCGGDFTELGTGHGAGAAGAAAGMSGKGGLGSGGSGENGGSSSAGASATGGTTPNGGTGGSGTSGSGGSGGGARCKTDADCPVSEAACELCADGSSACPWARCDAGQCTAGIDTCPSDPCAGKACGDICSPACPAGGICNGLVKYCDQNLSCQSTQPQCGGQTCSTDGDCPVSKIACKLCADGSSACPWAHCVAGQCQGGIDTCPDECQADSDCATPSGVCTICPNDQTVVCPWAHCDAGQCTSGPGTCPNPIDRVTPCLNAKCGDACTTCNLAAAEGGAGCTMNILYCDQNLTCQFGMPQCGGAQACQMDSDCPAVATTACQQCEDGSVACPWSLCVNGQCSGGVDMCPPTSASLCATSCGSGTVCVDQIGGPGPSAGFLCATQQPCGSSDRCACIVGQGTCSYVDGSPGYCQCNNGLK